MRHATSRATSYLDGWISGLNVTEPAAQFIAGSRIIFIRKLPSCAFQFGGILLPHWNPRLRFAVELDTDAFQMPARQKHRHPFQPDDERSFRAQRAHAMARLLFKRSRRQFLGAGLGCLAVGASAGVAYGALRLGLNVDLSPIEDFLVKHGVLRQDEVTRTVEYMDQSGELGGAKLIVKAWNDVNIKNALLTDANAAIDRANIRIGPQGLLLQSEDYKIQFVEDTAKTHNLIVCTLCSCYPTNILGTPPKWYRSAEYRYRAVSEPRKLLKEFGLNLPEDVSIVVHDSTADLRYIILPKRPDYTRGWKDQELEKIITRDVMIGVRSL
jgi:nitrile hydratase subunit alpha